MDEKESVEKDGRKRITALLKEYESLRKRRGATKIKVFREKFFEKSNDNATLSRRRRGGNAGFQKGQDCSRGGRNIDFLHSMKTTRVAKYTTMDLVCIIS